MNQNIEIALNNGSKVSRYYLKEKSALENAIQWIEEAFIRSKLPIKPDYDKANKLLVNIIESHFISKKEAI